MSDSDRAYIYLRLAQRHGFCVRVQRVNSLGNIRFGNVFVPFLAPADGCDRSRKETKKNGKIMSGRVSIKDEDRGREMCGD